jgi:hypothetical protein
MLTIWCGVNLMWKYLNLTMTVIGQQETWSSEKYFIGDEKAEAWNYNTSQNIQQTRSNRVNRTMNLYTSRNKHICKQGLLQNFSKELFFHLCNLIWPWHEYLTNFAKVFTFKKLRGISIPTHLYIRVGVPRELELVSVAVLSIRCK